MSLRTWLIRGFILALLIGVGLAAAYMQSYVRPEAVRAAVLATFQEQFPDADVTVEDAHLQVFGGISVRNLRIARKGDAEAVFFAPKAVISHDKEQVATGRLVIRKIELEAPVLHLERRSDGHWSFDGMTKPGPADKPVPTFVVTNATVTLVDKSPTGLPPLTLTNADFTLLNDPPPLYVNIRGIATARLTPPGGAPAAGPAVRVTLAGRMNRISGQFALKAEAPEVVVGPDLADLLAVWKPQAAEAVRALEGIASVRADVSFTPDAPVPFKYLIDLKLKDGRFSDPILPAPLEKIEATAALRDGRLRVEKATAKLGGTAVELSFETRLLTGAPPAPIPNPPSGLTPGRLTSVVKTSDAKSDDLLSALEDKLDRATLTVRDFPVNDELFDRLGERGEKLKKMFAPAGGVSATYLFTRPPTGGWKREFELRPTRLAMVYERFRYPLSNVTGLVKKTVTHAGADDTSIALTGTAAGQRIDISGTIRGDGPDPAIDLKVAGTNVPIDERLFEALPSPRHQVALKKLHARARGDFVAEIRQSQAINLAESVFRITVYDGTIDYERFPYPLEKVAGKITVFVSATDASRPVSLADPSRKYVDADRVELRDFVARHGTGTVWLNGSNEVLPDGRDRVMKLRVVGKECPVDADLHKAIAAIKLDAVWRTFTPRGQITFAVDVDIADRRTPVASRVAPPSSMQHPPTALLMKLAKEADPPFNPATDLRMTLNFEGPTVTPDFFPYDLDHLTGRVRYDGTRVVVEHFAAMHGASKWGLNAGDIRFLPDGRIWANLGRLEVAPIVTDAAFLAALPANLKKAAEQLRLRGPAEVTLRHMVVMTPPDRPATMAEPLPLPRIPAVARGQSSESPAETIPVGPDPDIYWAGELRMNGAALDAGLTWDGIQGRIACTGRYYGTHLGDVTGNVWLDAAHVADQPVTKVKMTFHGEAQQADPDRPGQLLPVAVRFDDVIGTLHRGTVGGQGRVVLADPVRYRLRLDATEVRLEDLAKSIDIGTTATLEGPAQASLRLETIVDPLTGKQILDGAGTLDVDRGHMLNLPVMLPLLKTLKLQAPDKTAFDEGHAVFTVRGDRIRVDHLDLLGDAISLGGAGEVDLRGDFVRFDFYTIWSQTLQRWLTTPFGDVTAFVSEKLFKIEVSRGPDGQLHYDPRAVPFVTDPFRAVAERVKRRVAPAK